MTEYILFDLDDTILDFHRAERIAIAGAFERMGILPTEALLRRYSECNILHWQKLERGEITRDEVLLGRFRMLFEELHIDCAAEKIQPVYEQLLGIGHYFIEGAEELLESLYGRYRLFIVSNGTAAVQKSRIESAGIGRYFERIFISEHIGFHKPAKEFFDHCFGEIPDFCRERALILGDSLTSDILGGINAGIRTIWFNPSHRVNTTDIRPDAEIDSLCGLHGLLN